MHWAGIKLPSQVVHPHQVVDGCNLGSPTNRRRLFRFASGNGCCDNPSDQLIAYGDGQSGREPPRLIDSSLVQRWVELHEVPEIPWDVCGEVSGPRRGA